MIAHDQSLKGQAKKAVARKVLTFFWLGPNGNALEGQKPESMLDAKLPHIKMGEFLLLEGID